MTVAAPLTAFATAVTVSVSPSTSVSLPARLASSTSVSSGVERESSTATGASFTAVTVTVTRPLPLSGPSETVYSKLAVPLKFASGVKVTTPAVTVAAPLTAFATAVTVSASPSASMSLAARFGKSAGVSSAVERESSTATGASLVEPTVTVTRPVSVRPPSETVYSKLAVPLKFAAGMKVTTPAATEAVPLTAPATAVTVSPSPSASVSLPARAERTTWVSSPVDAVSSTAIGLSATGATVIETVAIELARDPEQPITTTLQPSGSPRSSTRKVKLSAPLVFAAGVYVRAAPVPLRLPCAGPERIV